MGFAWLLLAGWAAQTAAVGGSAGRVVWVEAESFRDLGGWTSDSQFIDQMGSPYLMAIGLGTPVADAVATVALPRPGRWRLDSVPMFL
jgi:hypothetical protein